LVPSPSTITGILKRHDRVSPEESDKRKAFCRFEEEHPNDLWQMDFKGYVRFIFGPCHPFTVLDDHSRYAIGLQACANEQADTVKHRLTMIFLKYGLPRRLLADNGPPWAGCHRSDLTSLSVWLIRLGIQLIHSSPYHPQTLGKDERFHRTLKAEVLRYWSCRDLEDCQTQFDQWRDVYNLERPHEALDMDVPASRYRPSSRPFPACLPDIEYGPDDQVRKVQDKGEFYFKDRIFKITKVLRGLPVGLRPTATDGIYDVFFCRKRLSQLNLNESPKSVVINLPLD
jgi:transposase InsO family protein